MAGSLSPEQLQQFDSDGILVLRGLLDPERDLAPLVREYDSVLDTLASELLATGAIASAHSELPFMERVTRIYAESGGVYAQYFDFSLPLGKVEEDTPYWVGPAVFDLLRNKQILDVIESLIGPEIYSNPIQHVRIKPPESLVASHLSTSATVWHQDQGVTLPEADDTEMITVWLSLTRATAENGCLHVRPGSHRAGLLEHCPTANGPSIPLQVQPEEYRIVPVEPGDVVLMHRRLCHGSLPNLSDELRWSFDLRYQPTGQPTGRDLFPGFVARSASRPDTELRDAGLWAQLWHDTKAALAADPQPVRAWRWEPGSPLCA